MKSCDSVGRKNVEFGRNTSRFMNEENDWEHNMKVDAEESPIDCVSRDMLVQAIK